MSHTLSPHDRALVARFAHEAFEVDLGEMEAEPDGGPVFINYRKGDGRWARVVRTFGRYLMVFRYAPDQSPTTPPVYQAMFLAEDGSLIAFFPRQFEGPGFDKKVYEYLRDYGVRNKVPGALRFNGRNWQRKMGKAMADIARDWSSPWAP
jgi:hypothetical protein